MFSAGARVFFPGAGVFFEGAGGEKPGVCTALLTLFLYLTACCYMASITFGEMGAL